MEGTLGHLFWSCPTLRCFWEEIFNIYSWIYDLKLKPEGILAVLALRVWLCEMIAFLYIVEVRYGLANTHFKFFKSGTLFSIILTENQQCLTHSPALYVYVKLHLCRTLTPSWTRSPHLLDSELSVALSNFTQKTILFGLHYFSCTFNMDWLTSVVVVVVVVLVLLLLLFSFLCPLSFYFGWFDVISNLKCYK